MSRNIAAINPAVFTDHDGQIIAAGPETRSRGNVFALNAVHRHTELSIDASTPLSQWRGERMDLGMVMDGLLGRDGVGLNSG